MSRIITPEERPITEVPLKYQIYLSIIHDWKSKWGLLFMTFGVFIVMLISSFLSASSYDVGGLILAFFVLSSFFIILIFLTRMLPTIKYREKLYRDGFTYYYPGCYEFWTGSRMANYFPIDSIIGVLISANEEFEDNIVLKFPGYFAIYKKETGERRIVPLRTGFVKYIWPKIEDMLGDKRVRKMGTIFHLELIEDISNNIDKDYKDKDVL